MALIDELIQQPAGPNAQQTAGLNTPQNFRSSVAPLAKDPIEQFYAELMSIGEDLGILDSAIRGERSGPPPQLSKEQLQVLMQLFQAIPDQSKVEPKIVEWLMLQARRSGL